MHAEWTKLRTVRSTGWLVLAMVAAIITVATMKGGSGKSTLASCLAAHWHLNGRRPASAFSKVEMLILAWSASRCRRRHSASSTR